MTPREAFAEGNADEGTEAPSEIDEALGTRGQMRTRAESVSFDAKQKSLELKGDVRVDAPPFHLRSDHITLTRTRYGLDIEGDGRLAFCPCLATPLTVEFTEAIVAPPGELFLRDPKLEVYGVPVAYLPWFWMRSDEKIGVLPPDLAFRGQDGVFLGEGVHLPWKDRGARESLDLRGGAYLEGGFVADARLRSPVGTAKIRYDRLPGARAPVLPGVTGTNADDGLLVDARGATNAETANVAWDADVLRGRRGVASTSELDAAAKPWDRANATGSVGLGPVIAASGFRVITRRGGDLGTVDASGPFVGLRTSGGTRGITYDAAVEGGGLHTTAPLASDQLSYARAEVGLTGAQTFGALAASASARAAADVAEEGSRGGSDGAATARIHVGVPLVRAYLDEEDPRHDPLLHVVEPFAEAAVLHQQGDDLLGTVPGRGLAALDGTAPVLEGGVASTLGRWGSHEAVEVSAAGGTAHGSNATASGIRPLLRGRLSAAFRWLGAQVDAGDVLGPPDVRGAAIMGRLRLGREDGPHVVGNVAARGGLDPILARALTEASLEAPAGFFVREGTTGGAGLVVPWARAITTSGGADADATHRELVAVRGGLDLRDRCGCVTLHAIAAHRIGREGVDVWVTLDFAADR